MTRSSLSISVSTPGSSNLSTRLLTSIAIWATQARFNFDCTNTKAQVRLERRFSSPFLVICVTCLDMMPSTIHTISSKVVYPKCLIAMLMLGSTGMKERLSLKEKNASNMFTIIDSKLMSDASYQAIYSMTLSC